MSTIPFDDRDSDWEVDDHDDTLQLPRRPRRQFFNRRSAALAAIVVGAIGFYAGVRVEKGQVNGSSSSAGLQLPAALRSGRLPSGSGSSARGGVPGFGGPGGANASFGTVSSVDGRTIYLTDTSGNTVKVKLSSTTNISKSLHVTKQAVHPGDSVIAQGLKGSNGTLVATSISDSGASGGSATTGNSGSTSSGAAAVNSLFGSGNGG
jgi:hypothetical protein